MLAAKWRLFRLSLNELTAEVPAGGFQEYTSVILKNVILPTKVSRTNFQETSLTIDGAWMAGNIKINSWFRGRVALKTIDHAFMVRICTGPVSDIWIVNSSRAADAYTV